MRRAATVRAAKPVLVVDDNDDIRDALVMLLEQRGYSAIGAENGAAALALLRSGGVDPCLILLDLSMPMMDGATFRRQQQGDPALARVPVVLYSGVSDPAAEARELGVPHFFKKPLDLDKLVATVASHC